MLANWRGQRCTHCILPRFGVAKQIERVYSTFIPTLPRNVPILRLGISWRQAVVHFASGVLHIKSSLGYFETSYLCPRQG